MTTQNMQCHNTANISIHKVFVLLTTAQLRIQRACGFNQLGQRKEVLCIKMLNQDEGKQEIFGS